MYSSYYTTPYTSTATRAASTMDSSAITNTLLSLGIMLWILLLVFTAAAIVTIIAKWIVFKKANVDGWESLIPIHSEVVELQLGGIKTYWYFLNLIVICGIGPIILSFWKSIALAKAFGKGTGFGVLLALFPFVCYPILAWGNAEYVGPQNNEIPKPNTTTEA